MVKNYASTVTASKSVQHIEDVLIAHGANSILKQVEDKKLIGIAFIIKVNDCDIPFRLPARINCVEKLLKGNIKRPRSGTLQNITAQAERTAWKILSDWIDAQCALIDLQQVKLEEVFLPYIYDHSSGRTFFEKIENSNYSISNMLTYSK